MTQGIVIVVSVAVAGTLGCINREVAEVEPNQSREQVLNVPLNLKADLDLLFIVDNSRSMLVEQISLAANFGRFINVLSTIEGLGLPNIHIGVVSTDLGTGPFQFSGCVPGGDNGLLQNAPRSAACNPPAGRFISDVSDGMGGRITNYTDTLDSTFSCIAQLGIDGCGFEQPLESMRKALDGVTNPDNQGFLREDALLGIVLITDEDDCSTYNDQMFDTNQTSINDPLGPLSGHRCFEFGAVCDPDQPRQTGIKSDCTPRADSPYMYGVQEYVEFVKGLKSNELDIFVAGIMGPPNPVIVAADDSGNPFVKKSCETDVGEAEPPIRIQSFVDGFTNGTVATICEGDLQAALILIAEKMKRLFGDPCLAGAMALPPVCEVSEVLDFNETRVPKCDDAAGTAATNHPCYLFVDDTADCNNDPPRGCCGTDTGLAIKLFPEDRTVPTDTRLVVRCLLD